MSKQEISIALWMVPSGHGLVAMWGDTITQFLSRPWPSSPYVEPTIVAQDYGDPLTAGQVENFVEAPATLLCADRCATP